MNKRGLFGLLSLLATLSCDNGTDLASDGGGGAGAGGAKADGGASAGKSGGGAQSKSGSGGLGGAETGGAGGSSAGAGGTDETPPCPTDLVNSHGKDCSAFAEGTECSDGGTDPCQFGNSIICSGGAWQRRESIPAPCGGAGGGSSNGDLGDVCEPGENSCGQGLACCYPCGIEGCDFVCEPRCNESSPACNNGCLAKP